MRPGPRDGEGGDVKLTSFGTGAIPGRLGLSAGEGGPPIGPRGGAQAPQLAPVPFLSLAGQSASSIMAAMRRPTLLALLTLSACATTEKRLPSPPRATLAYPPTRAEATKDLLFGQEVPDPYRWLEPGEAPEVQSWMAAQDRLARAEIAALPGRDRLLARFRELYYVDSISAPYARGGRLFYSRTHADREKAVVYVREGEAGPERPLLDPNTLSADGTVSLGVWVPSPDGKWLAYSLKANNSDESTLYLKAVTSGEVSPRDVIPGAKYAHPSWTPAGDGFFYTWLPTDPAIPVADRPGFSEVRFHRLGTDPATDTLVRERTGDPTTFLAAELSHDGHWLFLYLHHGWTRTDVWVRDERRPGQPFAPLAVGLDAHFSAEAWGDRFYLLTDLEAPRFRLFRVDPARRERENWRELVPTDPRAVLQSVAVVGGRLALLWLDRAHSLLELRDLDGGAPRRPLLPGLGAVTAMTGEPDQPTAYLAFNSFTTPTVIERLEVATGATSTWARVALPIDPRPFTVEQVVYPSKDGTPVSMFLVHRRDLRRDGKTPFLLVGYGGFNVSMLPSFTPGIYPWLEAGGGFALPNLRGGGEYGEDWHRAGMGPRKQNVFDDFLAAADHLIRQGYTAPDRLAIRGGSNGGLLVGAALTQEPAKFRAVACAVPLLDMVRYHRFGSGRTWTSEYGTADDEAGFRALYAYSPYHRLTRRPYPAVLFLSADHDDRVDPLHARKMAAALQAATTSPAPVLLRVERNAGHGGADLIRQTVELSADTYAFLMREVGLVPAARAGATK